MSRTLTFTGPTRGDAERQAATTLGVAVRDLEVVEVVDRSISSGGETARVIDLVVRDRGAPEAAPEDVLLHGFARRAGPARPLASAPRAPSAGTGARAPAPVGERTPESRPAPSQAATPRRSAGPSPAESGDAASPAVLAPQAEAFLRAVLARMGIGADLRTEWDEKDVRIEILADEGLGGLLIGRHGQTLDALQYLTNRVVLPGAAARGRIQLDTEGYRGKHQRKLEQMAARIREDVLRTGRAVTVEDLTPRDRWIIHQALVDDDEVTTRSVGEGEERKLQILPR